MFVVSKIKTSLRLNLIGGIKDGLDGRNDGLDGQEHQQREA